MPISRESAAIKKCIKELELAFKKNPDDISVFLFQNDILTKRKYDEIRSTAIMRTPDEKAHLILEELTDAIEMDNEVYHTFVAHIRTEPDYKVPLKRLADADPTLNRGESTPVAGWEAGASVSSTIKEPEEEDAVAEAIAVLKTNDAKKKYQIKVGKIPESKRKYLDDKIESDEHIHQIADQLISWHLKPFLLKLEQADVHDIQEEHRGKPKEQRYAAVYFWRNKADDYATYRSLLCICVQGEWTKGANEIVNILKEI